MSTRWLACLLLLVGPLAQVSLAAGGAERGPNDLKPWDPSESCVGGSQTDPRLDRPVQFWRAGLTLTEVFASVAEQTGVKLDFAPSGDENARVRVNLYLNPIRPPSLRSLLAQLAWVLDCRFSLAEVEKQKVYLLMSSRIGESAAERLQAREAEEKALAARQEEQYRQAIRSQLGELADGLRLSREDAIIRYRGKEDRLLLVLLDPARRAAAQLVCRLRENQSSLRERQDGRGRMDGPRVDMDTWLLSGGIGEVPLECLTQEERAWVLQATGLKEKDVGSDRIRCGFAGPPGGSLHIWTERYAGMDQTGRYALWKRIGSDTTILRVRADDPMMPDEYRALAALLDEELTPWEEAEFSRHWEWAERQKQVVERQTADRLRAEIAVGRSLSPSAAQFLASLVLPLSPHEPHALWELQELTAKSSGLSVVSDCFAQEPRQLDRALSHLEEGKLVPVTALSGLSNSCFASLQMARSYSNAQGWWSGWEWGDAGDFLRFRSADRAVWRAALLPPELADNVETLLAASPYAGSAGDLQVAVDLRAWTRIAAGLTDVQVQYGGRMVYGDPGDPPVARRQRVLDDALKTLARNLAFFRFLETLDEQQWAALMGHGLHCGRGLRGDQLRQLAKGLREAANRGGSETLLARCVLRVTEVPPVASTPARHAIHVTVEGSEERIWPLWQLPKTLVIPTNGPERPR